jgi:hypothetical protein
MDTATIRPDQTNDGQRRQGFRRRVMSSDGETFKMSRAAAAGRPRPRRTGSRPGSCSRPVPTNAIGDERAGADDKAGVTT